MVIEYFLEWVETASVAKRTEAAAAMARAYLRNDISAEEREDVEAALTTLLEDPAPSVRFAMAEAFGARKKAPRHIISALACDTLDVSIITLSQSPVLHDTELVEFVETSQIENQIAIACRPWLSASVVYALCKHGNDEACTALLMNPVAEFSQDNLHMIAQRFGTNTELRNILLEREDLAAETRLVLIDKVGEALSSLVSTKGWLAIGRADKVIHEACDKASITFVANAESSDVIHLVRSMIESGRITVSYLLRAVCMGNISLVAHAFAELSGVRFSRVEAILAKDKATAFKALYDRAGLPKSAFVIFHTAIASWRRILASKEEINAARVPFLVTREVLETYSGQKDDVVDELILLLRKLSAEAARESSKFKATELANRSSEDLADVTINDDVVDAISADDIELDTDALIAEVQEEFDMVAESSDDIPEVEHEVMEVEPVDSADRMQIKDDYIDVSEAIMHAAMAKAA
jgi:uncharacterized protein (DUF2336 family)